LKNAPKRSLENHSRAAALPELLSAAGALAGSGAAFDGDALAAVAGSIIHHAPLAYEPVAAPCSLMNCGDAIYRRCAVLCCVRWHWGLVCLIGQGLGSLSL
jgi:hypothetical protein